MPKHIPDLRCVGAVLVALGSVTLLLDILSDVLLLGQALKLSPSLLPGAATICAGIAIVRLKSRHRSASIALFLTVVGGVSGIAATVVAIGNLEPGVGFVHDQTTGRGKVRNRVVRPAGLLGTRVCLCTPDQEMRIALPGGFETMVSIYDSGEADPRPGVVIVHGNTWMGSGLSTYRLMATLLAKKGYIVLSFDFPGFGRSDDPFGQGPSSVAAAHDRLLQVNAAIDYLIENTDVDRSNITVFGHSGGVDWAMRAGAANSLVSKVAVMVAPPPVLRRDQDRKRRAAYFSERGAEQYRFVYGKERPAWYHWKLTRMDERYGDDGWAPYTRPGHKPILLILGERDQPTGHEAVLAKFDAVVGPKKFTLLDRSDHYLNTAQSLGLVFYDLDVAHDLAEAMASWINSAN